MMALDEHAQSNEVMRPIERRSQSTAHLIQPVENNAVAGGTVDFSTPDRKAARSEADSRKNTPSVS